MKKFTATWRDGSQSTFDLDPAKSTLKGTFITKAKKEIKDVFSVKEVLQRDSRGIPTVLMVRSFQQDFPMKLSSFVGNIFWNFKNPNEANGEEGVTITLLIDYGVFGKPEIKYSFKPKTRKVTFTWPDGVEGTLFLHFDNADWYTTDDRGQCLLFRVQKVLTWDKRNMPEEILVHNFTVGQMTFNLRRSCGHFAWVQRRFDGPFVDCFFYNLKCVQGNFSSQQRIVPDPARIRSQNKNIPNAGQPYYGSVRSNFTVAQLMDLRALGLYHEVQSWAEVKTAYKALARKHHPDFGGDRDTMAKINLAFTRLKEIVW